MATWLILANKGHPSGVICLRFASYRTVAPDAKPGGRRVGKGDYTVFPLGEASRTPCPRVLPRISSNARRVGTAHDRNHVWKASANAHSSSKTGVNALMAHPTCTVLGPHHSGGAISNMKGETPRMVSSSTRGRVSGGSAR